MSLDPVINFGKAPVTLGYSSTATTIVLAAGKGSRFPSLGGFNTTWWNSTDYEDPADDPLREIIRVPSDGLVGDSFVGILRGQEGTVPADHNISGKSYSVVLSITKKMIDDIGTALSEGSGPPPFRSRPGPAMPLGLLMKGANISPSDASFVDMIVQWDTQFPGFIKPSLDLAKSNGLNCVRLIPGLCGITQGDYTREVFLSAYQDFIEYCALIGLYVYATVGDSLFMTGTGQGAIDALKPEAMAMVQMLDRYPNVVAIDMWNEFFYNQGFFSTNSFTVDQRHAIAADWTASAKLLTNLPITWSLPTQVSNNSSAMWGDITNQTKAKAYCDYIDMHVYYAMSPSDPAAYVTALAGVPLLIGEVGYNITNSQSTRAADYAVLASVVTQNNLVGVLAWEMVDGFSSGFGGGHPEWNFGLYDHSFNPYSQVIAAVQSWPLSLSQSSAPNNVISSSVTYYGSSTGNDGNSGLSSGSPKTAQGMLNMLSGKVVGDGVIVSLQLADATYGPLVFRAYSVIGTGKAILQGNSGSRTAVFIDAAGAGIALYSGEVGFYRYEIRNIKVRSGATFTEAVRFDYGRFKVGNGLTFVSEDSTTNHIYLSKLADFDYDSVTYYVEGGAGVHIFCDSGVQVFLNGPTVNCNDGTQAFSQFFIGQKCSLIGLYSGTGGIPVTNGSITAQRWQLTTNSILQTYGGQNPDTFFPGNSNGSTSSGAQVIIS